MSANRSAHSKVRDHGDVFLKVSATTRVEIEIAIEIQRESATKSAAQMRAAHNHHVKG